MFSFFFTIASLGAGVPIEDIFIDTVGEYATFIDTVGEYKTSIDTVGEYTSLINTVGEFDNGD